MLIYFVYEFYVCVFAWVRVYLPVSLSVRACISIQVIITFAVNVNDCDGLRVGFSVCHGEGARDCAILHTTLKVDKMIMHLVLLATILCKVMNIFLIIMIL